MLCLCLLTCFAFIVTDVLRHCQQISYEAHLVSVCDGSGDVIIRENDSPCHIHLYCRHQRSTQLQTTIQTGGDEYRYIAVSCDSVYGQKYRDSDTTYKHNRRDGTKSVITHFNRLLISCLYPDIIVYARREDPDDGHLCYLSIQHPDREVKLRPRPPRGLWDDRWLSICCLSGRIIVINHNEKTMDTFSLDGEK